jgi:hypothetical protein
LTRTNAKTDISSRRAAIKAGVDALRTECIAVTREECGILVEAISDILKGHVVTLEDAQGGVPTLTVDPPLLTTDYRSCTDLTSWLDQDDSHGGSRRTELDELVDGIERSCMRAASDCGLPDFSIGVVVRPTTREDANAPRPHLANVPFLVQRVLHAHAEAETLDPADRRLPAIEHALKRIMDMMTGGGDPETELCSFGEPAKRRQKWLLVFQDAEVGTMVFDAALYGDAEAELLAREAYHSASVQWNCTLFKVADWSDEVLKPFVDHENVVPPLAGVDS